MPGAEDLPGRADLLGDGGASSPGPVLRFLAAAVRAKAVVEVGTGSGADTLWLLRGMQPDGVLTSIDIDPDAQRAARTTLADAGVPGGRTRLIAGLAAEVLPRLTESAYDLVSVGSVRTEYATYLELGLRLLRPGGMIVFAGVRPEDRHAGRDSRAMALRALFRAIKNDETLVPAALPVGQGILALVKS